MRDQLLPPEMAQRVLQLHQLNEDVMFRVKPGSGLRRFEVKRKPFLDAFQAGALCKVEEESKVETKRCSEYRVPTKEIDLDLHFVTKPSKNVDAVPAFLIVTP